MLLHHTLGNGDFNVFANISKQISCTVSLLNDVHEAATLIDNAIRECYLQSRPVYIALPTDIVQKKVDGDRLKAPLDLEYPPNDPERENYVVDVVLRYLRSAKDPVILVDARAIRDRALKETHELVKKSGMPTFVAPMGKGAVDETLPNYGGVYAGDGSNAGVRERVEASDLVLSIGSIKSDFNTAGFTYRISRLNTIDFHSECVKVRYSEYPGVRMNGVLRKITEKLETPRIESAPRLCKLTFLDSYSVFSAFFLEFFLEQSWTNQLLSLPAIRILDEEEELSESAITQAWFWPRLSRWLQPDDIIITETGTANFGIWESRFPPNVTAISQVLWGSIGYAIGACQGAALAAKELGLKRTILFTGDGAFQLTAQEISTMLRHKLNPIIFVICNSGYTIERFIHGWKDSYNDIQTWEYKALVESFGAPKETYEVYRVEHKRDLEALFGNAEFASEQTMKLRFVELVMPWDDAPRTLKGIAAAAAKRNAET